MSYNRDVLPRVARTGNLDPHQADILEQLHYIHIGLNFAINDYEEGTYCEMLFKGQEEYLTTLVTYRKRVKEAMTELELLGAE